MEETLEAVNNNGNKNIWLGGDFNLPQIDWDDMKTLPGNSNAKLSNMLIDCVVITHSLRL